MTTRSPIHFSYKKSPIPALIKKELCVTREQLTFSDSDDDFEYEWFTRAPLAIIILVRKRQFSSLVAQCTIVSMSEVEKDYIMKLKFSHNRSFFILQKFVYNYKFCYLSQEKKLT